MNVKKRLLALPFLLFASYQPIHPNIKHETNSRFLDVFDDFDLFQDDYFGDMLDSSEANLVTRLAPQDVIDIIKLGAGEDMALLQQNFFLRTNDLNLRNILDMPVFEPQTLYPPTKWTVGGQLFWNKTGKSNFTKDETGLAFYLALTQPNFLDVIENQLRPLFEDFDLNIDIEKILSLFKNMTVEDRRLGAMFHAQYFWKRLTLRYWMPLYYHERNLNFPNEAEKQAVFDEFGVTEEDQDEEFQDAHFVSDQLGFGDGRLEVDAIVSQGETFNARLGGMVTLPIAFAFKKGLKGTYFPKTTAIQRLMLSDIDLDAILNGEIDLNNLFDLTENPDTPEELQAAFNTLTNFLLGSLDHMNATLLDASLGNRHLGIGGVFRSETKMSMFFNRPWAENIIWLSRGSVEYFFPRTMKRFFDKKINEHEFNKRDFCEAMESFDNLQFIEQELTNRFYPMYLRTRVQPGWMFRWMSRFVFRKNKKWSCFIGSDWWIQTKETFSVNAVEAPSEILSQIRVEAAKKPRPYQGKIQAGFIYQWERPTRDWLISLNGDYTLYNSGVGEDYTISINIETRF